MQETLLNRAKKRKERDEEWWVEVTIQCMYLWAFECGVSCYYLFTSKWGHLCLFLLFILHIFYNFRDRKMRERERKREKRYTCNVSKHKLC